MTKSPQALVDAFERLEISASDFHHIDHVKVAYAMLDRYEFVEACARYAATIRAMAEGAGAPDKFNATITFAFMSLIAERKGPSNEGGGWSSFLSTHPDLLEKDVLAAWYSPERLSSSTARRQFVLPDRI